MCRRVKVPNRRSPPRRRSARRGRVHRTRSVPRMIDVTILAVTENPSWLEFFWTKSRSVQGSRLVVTGSMEEACDLLICTDARLIVVDWQDSTVSSDQMDQLLWANSILAHPATVLVVAESYRTDLALSLFQMGVDEYIGVSEHSDQLRTILDGLLARTDGAFDSQRPAGFPGSQAGAGSTALASALGCGGVFGLRAGLATSFLGRADRFYGEAGDGDAAARVGMRAGVVLGRSSPRGADPARTSSSLRRYRE